MKKQAGSNPEYALQKGWIAFVHVLVGLLSIGSLILPIADRPDTYNIYVGSVSPQDIQAPYATTYTSTALTEQAIESAVQAVPDRYHSPNPAITKNQLDQLSDTLTYITNCRADQYATQKQKVMDISRIPILDISNSTAMSIIALNDQQWTGVKNESLRVLEQVMRETIIANDIEENRRRAYSNIQYDLPAEQVEIIFSLIHPMIVSNSKIDQSSTDAAKKEVANSVSPVTKSYIPGEVIVRRGQMINPVIFEALDHFGLVKPQKYFGPTLAAVAIVVLISFLLAIIFLREQSVAKRSLRALLLISIFFLSVLFSARFLLPNRTIIPYLFPVAAFGLTLATLFTFQFGLIYSILLTTLITYQLSNSLEITIFYVLTTLVGILVIDKGRRLSNFIYAGLAVGISGGIVIFAYRLPEGITDWAGMLSLIGASLLNGAASASLTILIQYIFAQILGLTTALQLMDISRPDHPLLRYMLRNSPGSYQHSLQVANLAEQGAESICADSLLVRVGALYHDVGKAENPHYFIENQVPGNIDTHDDLDPSISASIIIKHVADGIKLAKKYHIPAAIQDFITEHHGTMITKYQYSKAVQSKSSNIDKEKFRYPGPKPQSIETAILLLADGCEARVRAELPSDNEELSKTISDVFDSILQTGQLDDTELTFKDLKLLQNSFCKTLTNAYHPRLQYPDVPISI